MWRHTASRVLCKQAISWCFPIHPCYPALLTLHFISLCPLCCAMQHGSALYMLMEEFTGLPISSWCVSIHLCYPALLNLHFAKKKKKKGGRSLQRLWFPLAPERIQKERENQENYMLWGTMPLGLEDCELRLHESRWWTCREVERCFGNSTNLIHLHKFYLHSLAHLLVHYLFAVPLDKTAPWLSSK